MRTTTELFLIFIVSLNLSVTLSTQVLAQVEDDGEFIPNDVTPEEREQIEDTGREDWEDAGRPGERDDDNKDANPYCDQVSDEYMASGGICHDRKDYDQETGLYPCNDGLEAYDWRDCRDAS